MKKENDSLPSPALSDMKIARTLRHIEEHLAKLREQQQTASRVWLTVGDVASELQVSRDTIERLIASGMLRVTTIRTPNAHGLRCRYRIRREWVEAFLLKNMRPELGEEPKRSRRQKPDRDFIG